MDEFLKNNSDTIIVGIVMAILGAVVIDPFKALVKKIGEKITDLFLSRGWGSAESYNKSLAKERLDLKIVSEKYSAYPPRLQKAYVSLKFGSGKESGASLSWQRMFSGETKKIVILGGPGAGKTTLLDYMTLVFTGQLERSWRNLPKSERKQNPINPDDALRLQLKKPTVIYVRLREANGKPLWDCLIAPTLQEWNKIPEQFFKAQLEKGKCLVLLDGLDEILNSDDRAAMVKQIKDLADSDKFGGNWWIVTSRFQEWKLDYLTHFQPYRIQDFDDRDSLSFIREWNREITRSEFLIKAKLSRDDEEDLKPETFAAIKQEERRACLKADPETEELWKKLSANQGLSGIAHTPLLLALVVLVYKNGQDLPNNRAKLFKECLEILLINWDKTHKNLSWRTEAKDRMDILRSLAFDFLSENELERDLPYLRQFIQPLLPDDKPEVTPEFFIKEIVSRSGVLRESGGGKYGFTHRAFLDALAASYMEAENLDHLAIEHAAKPEWREAIALLVSGLTFEGAYKRAAKIIQALFENRGENAASLALVGWCLQGVTLKDEKGKNDYAALQSAIKVEFTKQLDKEENAEDFSKLSSAFSAADPHAMQTWMGGVLSGRSPELQKRVLSTLLKMKSEEGKPFTPTLTRILVDSHAETNLRAQCALTLAKLKPEADAELWKVLESARENKDLKSVATWAYCELGKYEELGLKKIPAGNFLMGSSDNDKDAERDEKPQDTLYLPDYYIAKFPVTVDDYRAFVQESGHEARDKDSLEGIGNHPVRWVYWEEALKYAQWKGFTLPSEAEWEKAASWDDAKKEKRIYPWGNDWKEGYANTEEKWGKPSLWKRLLRRQTGKTTTRIDTFPKGNSPYGCSDMSGNVWEWTRSVYKPYPYNANDGREDESASGFHVVRGGSYYFDKSYARCARRNGSINYDDYNGLRVCASPISPETLLNSDS